MFYFQGWDSGLLRRRNDHDTIFTFGVQFVQSRIQFRSPSCGMSEILSRLDPCCHRPACCDRRSLTSEPSDPSPGLSSDRPLVVHLFTIFHFILNFSFHVFSRHFPHNVDTNEAHCKFCRVWCQSNTDMVLWLVPPPSFKISLAATSFETSVLLYQGLFGNFCFDMIFDNSFCRTIEMYMRIVAFFCLSRRTPLV